MPRKRIFKDAPTRVRCQAIVKLKDGTTADCGRRAVEDGLCRQHYKIAARDTRRTTGLQHPN